MIDFKWTANLANQMLDKASEYQSQINEGKKYGTISAVTEDILKQAIKDLHTAIGEITVGHERRLALCGYCGRYTTEFKGVEGVKGVFCLGACHKEESRRAERSESVRRYDAWAFENRHLF